MDKQHYLTRLQISPNLPPTHPPAPALKIAAAAAGELAHNGSIPALEGSSHGGGRRRGAAGDGRRQADPAGPAVPRVPRREAGGEEAGPEVRGRRGRLDGPRRRRGLGRHRPHRQLHRHLQDSQGRGGRPVAQPLGVGGSVDRRLHAARVPPDLRRPGEGREAPRRGAGHRRLPGCGDTEAQRGMSTRTEQNSSQLSRSISVSYTYV
ncbi:hypothetical protein VPH35_012731 [Triticum aestivum]